MRDYIAEANHYMYDDDYIVETKVKIDGKAFASKKAAEADLKSKGLKGKQLEDKLARAVKLLKNQHSEELQRFKKSRDVYDKEKSKHDKLIKKYGEKHEIVKNNKGNLKDAESKMSSDLETVSKTGSKLTDAKIKLHQHQKKVPTTMPGKNLKKHLEDAETVLKFHDTHGDEDDWAFNNHDYDRDEHQEAYDNLKSGKGTKRDMDNLKWHNKAAAYAHQEIQGQTMPLNYYYHKRSLEG